MWDGEEDDAFWLGEWLVECALADVLAEIFGDIELIDGFFIMGVIHDRLGVGDAGSGEQAAHRVGDDDHAVEVAVMALGASIGAGFAHEFTEFHATINPWISGWVVIEPDLVSIAEPWFGDEFIDHIFKSIWAGDEAVDEDDGDFFGVVWGDEIDAGFFHVSLGEDDILDFQVIEFAHVPVERVGGGPICGEGVSGVADADIFLTPAFRE